MRLESKKKVRVGNVIIGGAKPLICIPLVASQRADLLGQAAELSALKPDLIEWRIDGLAGLDDTDDWLKQLAELRAVCGTVPLIFTCRSHLEGGLKELEPMRRQAVIEKAMASGHVDIVDIEMCNSDQFIARIKQAAEHSGTRLILSHHNFKATPEEEFLVNQLVKAEALGGDIAKIAVMPNSYSDVLTLLQASLRARSGLVAIPQVTISMGDAGVISRVAGGLFGSDITFAIGRESSAPGQVSIQALRRSMELFYGRCQEK